MMIDPQPAAEGDLALPPGVTQQQLELEAKRNLTELRKAINRFQSARLSTNAAIAGTADNKKGLPPWEIARKVRELRDVELTNKAVADLRDLMTLLYGRVPTESELEAGPPDGEALGVWVIPGSAIALAAIAGGTWTLSGLFDYLTQRELRIQAELGIRNTSLWDTLWDWAPTAAVVGGVGVGALLLYRWNKGRKAEAPTPGDDADRYETYVERIVEEDEPSASSSSSPAPSEILEAHEDIPALPAHEEAPEDELAELKRQVREGAGS